MWSSKDFLSSGELFFYAFSACFSGDFFLPNTSLLVHLQINLLKSLHVFLAGTFFLFFYSFTAVVLGVEVLVVVFLFCKSCHNLSFFN